MNITIKDVLKHPILKDAVIIAGKKGIDKKISRISVFDCPINDDIIDKKIIQKNDFFISGLYQFEREPLKIRDLICILSEAQCSGICITDENLSLVNKNVIDLADELEFPIILVNKMLPYASIMESINKMILLEYVNVFNEFKIEKLMYEKLNVNEILEIIECLDNEAEENMCILIIEGDFKYNAFEIGVMLNSILNKGDVCVNYKDKKVIFLSDFDKLHVQKKIITFKSQLIRYFYNFKCGISSINLKSHADISITEAKRALILANANGESFVEYNAMGIMAILILLKDNEELKNYYFSILNLFKKYDEDNKLEFFECIKYYVKYDGDYKKIAKSMNQHENTIRYRINKIKNILNLNNSLIEFHETLSLLVKLDMIIIEHKN